MKDKKLPLHIVLIITVLSAYWPAPLAYSVIPNSMRSVGIAFLPGMCLGFVSEIFGNALIGNHMFPNDGVGIIVGFTGTVAAMTLSIKYGQRGRFSLSVSSCLISVMSLLTYVLFRFCNG